MTQSGPTVEHAPVTLTLAPLPFPTFLFLERRALRSRNHALVFLLFGVSAGSGGP